MALLTAGIALLVYWFITTDLGRDSLAAAPVRRNRMPWYTPLAVFGAWVGAVGIALLADDAARTAGFAPWLGTMLKYGILVASNMVFIVLMVYMGGRLFVRGLAGFGLRMRRFVRDLGWSLVHLLAILPPVYGLIHLVRWAGERFVEGFEMDRNEALVELLQHEQAWVIGLIAVFAVVVVPIFEELLFRGLLQTSLRNILRRPWAAVIVASVVFAVLHPPTHMPALLVLSLAIGYSYERSGSLMRPIFMHIVFNGMNVAGALWSTGGAG